MVAVAVGIAPMIIHEMLAKTKPRLIAAIGFNFFTTKAIGTVRKIIPIASTASDCTFRSLPHFPFLPAVP